MFYIIQCFICLHVLYDVCVICDYMFLYMRISVMRFLWFICAYMIYVLYAYMCYRFIYVIWQYG